MHHHAQMVGISTHVTYKQFLIPGPDLYQHDNVYAPWASLSEMCPLDTNSPTPPISISTSSIFPWRQYETWSWLVAKAIMWWQQKVTKLEQTCLGISSAAYNPHTDYDLDSVKNKRSPKSSTGVAHPISKRYVDVTDAKYPSHSNPVPI